MNAIRPGWVDGGPTHQAMPSQADPAALRPSANAHHLPGRIATLDDIANAAPWLIADLAASVTGTALPVDGGLLGEALSE